MVFLLSFILSPTLLYQVVSTQYNLNSAEFFLHSSFEEPLLNLSEITPFDS